MNQRMEEIEREVKSNREDIEAVGNKVEDLSNISNKNTKDIKELPQTIEDSLLYELREREDRKGNLLFHNIAEANEEMVKLDKRRISSVSLRSLTRLE